MFTMPRIKLHTPKLTFLGCHFERHSAPNHFLSEFRWHPPDLSSNWATSEAILQPPKCSPQSLAERPIKLCYLIWQTKFVTINHASASSSEIRPMDTIKAGRRMTGERLEFSFNSSSVNLSPVDDLNFMIDAVRCCSRFRCIGSACLLF